MLEAEKLHGEAGRAAAEPNIADLEDIVRFLQVSASAVTPPLLEFFPAPVLSCLEERAR